MDDKDHNTLSREPVCNPYNVGAFEQPTERERAAAHKESTSDESSLDEFRLGNYVSLDEQERRREAFEKEFHKRPRSDMEASERLVLETVPEEPVSEDEGAAKPFLGEKARKQFSFYQEPIESDENLEEKLAPDDDSEGKRARREELFDTDTDSFEEDARSIETDPMGVPIPKSRKKRNRSTAKTSLSDIVADIVPYFEQKMKTRVEGEDSKRKDELWSSSSCASRSSGSRTYLERLTEKRSRPAVQQAAIDNIKQEYIKSRQLEELNLKLRGKSAHPKPKSDKKKDKRRNSCVFC
ncbi:hypothetical protein BaRGS_00018130 [Batillaria attramentaria]|uniref:Uncharacterized protein n=1 Tax=Batillaria attramentaria TaxID=370345 RepID=A0ABD0KUT5_9CAEN